VLAVKQGQTTLYVTILGSPTRARRNADLERLLTWGFGVYSIVPAIETGQVYAKVDLPYGRAPVALEAGAALQAFVRPGTKLTERIVAPRFAQLPIRRGEVLGRIEIWAGADLIGRRPLVASRAVAAPSTLGRVDWYARRTVHDIAGLFT
jgi:D-alanyl-D-alanine carboxypeptidase (penicillin-binding protein 5/6)